MEVTVRKSPKSLVEKVMDGVEVALWHVKVRKHTLRW